MIDTNLLNKLYPNKSAANKIASDTQAVPEPMYPIVTQTDAENGYIYRYFVRSANDESYIVEIDKIQYDNLKTNYRFITAQIRWKIVGKKETYISEYGAMFLGVEDINRQSVKRADLTFGGLERYIQNYLEYWLAEV